MQQFMAGWQMGQGRNENQRRNQELEMERQRQQQMMAQRAEEFALQKEEFAVRKKQLAAEEAAHQFDAKRQAAAMMSRNQQTLPPETQDLGGGTTLNLGPAVQPRAPITAAIPGAPEGTPEVPMPFREDVQDQQYEQNLMEGKVFEVPNDPSIPEAFRGRVMPNNAATAALLQKWVEGPKLQHVDLGDRVAWTDPQGNVVKTAPKGKIPGPPGEPGELNPKQRSTYLTITNKFQSDKIMEKAGNAAQADQLADEAIKNPGKATNQLATLYLLVKNLDPDSAVREGELGLAQATQSYWQKFQTSWARVSEGQIISPEAAKELAQATKLLSKQWAERGSKRVQQYKAQASGAGIGTAFDQYLNESGIGAPSGGGGGDYEATSVPGVRRRKIQR
jgi:hypothetical protein